MSNVSHPKWQRAIIKRADAMPEMIGRHVWTEIGHVEACGGHGCKIPSIFVNHEFDSPFGQGQDVMHLDGLELLDEFEFGDLPIITWQQFLAGQEK